MAKNSKIPNAKDKNKTNSDYHDFTDNVISIKDITSVVIENLKQKRDKYEINILKSRRIYI